MSEQMTAVDVLRKYQKQCDEDGIEVQVSRQALDEVLGEVERLKNTFNPDWDQAAAAHESVREHMKLLKESQAEVARLQSAHTDDINQSADMLIAAGLSTGHADTTTALIGEVLDQVGVLRAEVKRLETRNTELNVMCDTYEQTIDQLHRHIATLTDTSEAK